VTEYNADVLAQRLRELAFLNKGIKITFEDERTTDERRGVMQYKGGIVEYVKYLDRNKEPLHRKPIYLEMAKEDVEVEVALQYNTATPRPCFSLRQQHQHDRRRHAPEWLPRGLTRTLNVRGKKNQPALEGEGPSPATTCAKA
jgi:DNA gyrase subunit B